ncbi:YkgJ family cysteine cluster protein [Maribacter forsetii]|uniref:YkgJ family cysteine cluster protein n=1 Tax=Maribacter forsetii TaxID=444515 RepID=UPI000560EB8A|nr:YkgJ family cysteine cluster protein [Maribacter forsetii]
MNSNLTSILKNVKSVHNDLDKVIGSIDNMCRKGCAHCCYQPIEIVACEELPIAEYINNRIGSDLYKKVRKQIMDWSIHFNEHFAGFESLKTVDDVSHANRAYREKVNEDRLACPFLVNNLCSIYEVRPLSCRSHIELESATLCEKDGLKESTNNIKKIRNYHFEKLIKNPNSTLRYLPVAISRTFGFNKIFKPHPMIKLN